MRKISKPGYLLWRKQIGTFGQLGGLLVLVGGMVVTFYYADRLDLAYGAMLLGFFLVTIGAGFTNRWGRTPAPDQAIDDLLKGLDDRYTIVHFRLGAEHALFTPGGILALLPKYERGQVSYDGKRWRQTGVSGFTKIFGVESLGNPVLDAAGEANALERRLKKILKGEELPKIQPIVVFLNERTLVNAENSPVPALHPSKIKDFIRRMPKGGTLRPDLLQRVLESIGENT
jgi:hypothetical protein